VTEPAVAGALESLFGRFDWPDTLSTVVAVVIALSIVVFLHLLFGEMVPRSIALAAPERALLALSVPVGAFVAVFRPLIWFLNLLARLGARLFGVEPSDELRSAATSAELSIMLEESAEVGLLEDDEVVLLTSALSFVERRVSEIMVPSSRMVTVPSDATVADIERVVVESGHTRILLVGGANGSSARRRGGSSAAVGARAVAGFVHAKDLLRMAPEQRDRPVPIRPRSLMAVPEEITLPALLVDMRARRAHLAVVIDDHGATVGMVTMEDVLECIVGDIRDESDRLVERLDEQSDDEADEGGARRGDR
ncbi:MAG TPA: hemolysin family protein, partial [Microthrixaceae bacterium]|nr:hemolysin family protein [Microthrixaceae bacterium]